MTGTTNFFGDLTKNIFDHVGKEAFKVTSSIHDALVLESPNPETSDTSTGALRSNWRSGIVPNSFDFHKRVPGEIITNTGKKQRRSGLNKVYYVWNNTPYLDFVNDGLTKNGTSSTKTERNRNFVQRGILQGLLKAKSMV